MSEEGKTVDGGAGSGATNNTSLPALGEKWYDSLPDDIKTEPSLRTIHDIGSLAKSFVHAQKAIGADKVIIPSKHATDEDWSKFWKKVGHPEKIEDYKIDPPKDVKINEDFFKAAKETMFKLGVLPKQAGEILNWYIGKEQEIATKQTEVGKSLKTEWEGKLKSEWGDAFDKKVAEAKQAVSFMKDPDLLKVMEETGFGSHPSVVKAFQKLGSILVEDKIIEPVGAKGKSPSEAQAEYETIMGNPEHPYNDVAHPRHKGAVEEMTKLFQQMYPEGS